MDINDPFFGATLKLEWADQHVRDINAAIGESLFGVRGQVYSNLRYTYVDKTCQLQDSFRTVGKVREDILVFASYALYNLRSALDHVACAISMGSRRDKADFIICDKLTEFEQTGRGAIKGGRLCHRSLAFMRSFKPYKRGNQALWTLNRLNIIDKHKTLLIVRGEGFSVPKASGPLIKRRRWRPLDANKKVPSLIGETKKNAMTFVNVSFLQVKPIEHKPIVIVLKEIWAAVEEIVVTARLTFPNASIPPL